MSPSNFEILAYDDTPLGMLYLRRRELLNEPGTLVTEVTLNHEFLMSSLHTDSERALASVALEMNAGQNLNVMIGGLGLGYTAAEILKSPRVSALGVIEFLPQVISWLDDGLVPLSESLKGDSRLEVVQGDVYQILAGPPSTLYDLILIDVDHSPDEHLNGANSAFYTADGLELAKQHLSDTGILGIWSFAESSPFVDALRAAFREVRVEPVTFENRHMNETSTDWLFFGQM